MLHNDPRNLPLSLITLFSDLSSLPYDFISKEIAVAVLTIVDASKRPIRPWRFVAHSCRHYVSILDFHIYSGDYNIIEFNES